MTEIKRGTTPTLKIKFDIADLSIIDHVDFILKQDCKEECTTFVSKTYPSASVTLDSSTGVFSVSYTEQETRKFAHDTKIYLDTRPVTTNGNVLPTEIVGLFTYNTLFAAVTNND